LLLQVDCFKLPSTKRNKGIEEVTFVVDSFAGTAQRMKLLKAKTLLLMLVTTDISCCLETRFSAAALRFGLSDAATPLQRLVMPFTWALKIGLRFVRG
jgi:hypothetical protein